MSQLQLTKLSGAKLNKSQLIGAVLCYLEIKIKNVVLYANLIPKRESDSIFFCHVSYHVAEF